MKRRWKKTAGFTLVELIVVIAILGILAGVAVPVYSGYVKKANLAADQTLVDSINTAFAAACIENVVNIADVTTGEATITINADKSWTPNMVVGEVNLTEDFKAYMGGDAAIAAAPFKVMIGLRFDENLDRFVESTRESTFDRPGVMAGIEQTFNKISGMLKGYDDMSATAIENAIKADFDDNLVDALGMDGMLEGYLNATELEGDALKAALEKYCPDYRNAEDKDAWIAANGDKIAQVKANLGVMHFANSANDGDSAQVKSNVMSSLDTIIAAMYSGTTVNDDEVWDYYKSTSRGKAKIEEVGEAAAKAGDFADFRGYSYMLGMTGDQLACVSKAIGDDYENAAGINTLGALYALSAGYFNNPDYYTGEAKDIGSFPVVIEAMTQPNFMDYYNNQAGADIEAYLEQMRGLSAQENLDLTKADVFNGVFTTGSN